MGLRVKTGRAIAVLLSGPADAPRVLARREISLVDPAHPETRQPYHAALGLEGAAAEAVVAGARCAVERVAARELAALAEELRGLAASACPCGALVVSSDADPARIANPHVRAHAGEGRLFREALETALRAQGLAPRVFLARALPERAARALGRGDRELAREVAALGAALGPPWRGEEKAAALAAWTLLAG